jgi:large subunit ribosomal protein L10
MAVDTAREPRPEKVAVVEEISAKLRDSEAAVLTEYRGLTVPELAALRESLRASDTEFKVFKNTLARRAAADAGYDDLVPLLVGPTGIAFVKGDAAAAAKALREFGRNSPAFIVKGGWLGSKSVSSSEIDALADLPSREVLLSQLAGLFVTPLAQTASLFEAGGRSIVYAVQALIDQREAAGEKAEAPAAEAPAPEAPAPDAAESEAAESEAADTPAPEVTEAAESSDSAE